MINKLQRLIKYRNRITKLALTKVLPPEAFRADRSGAKDNKHLDETYSGAKAVYESLPIGFRQVLSHPEHRSNVHLTNTADNPNTVKKVENFINKSVADKFKNKTDPYTYRGASYPSLKGTIHLPTPKNSPDSNSYIFAHELGHKLDGAIERILHKSGQLSNSYAFYENFETAAHKDKKEENHINEQSWYHHKKKLGDINRDYTAYSPFQFLEETIADHLGDIIQLTKKHGSFNVAVNNHLNTLKKDGYNNTAEALHDYIYKLLIPTFRQEHKRLFTINK